jgi:hypothetical protein
MAIRITAKETPRKSWSSINIYGQLRDDIRTIAIHTGRSIQDVGYTLLTQAVKEVMPTLPPLKYKNNKKGNR